MALDVNVGLPEIDERGVFGRNYTAHPSGKRFASSK